MKKRVAIISNLSWNLYNFRMSLMYAMREAGYEVIAIAPYDEYSDRIVEEGFKFYALSMNAKGINPIEDVKTMYAFYKIFKESSPEIICQYTIKPNIYGSIVANYLNIKMVNNIAGLGTLFGEESLVTNIAKKLYRFSQKNADRVFFQNREDYELFINEKIVSRVKCDILPGSGVDTNKFIPINKPQSTTIRFLLIARIIWEKGIAEYVESAKIIKRNYPNVEFCILGFLDVENPGAVRKDEMDEWVNKGIINYLGTSDNVHEVIATADCIVLPSFYREGTPKTLLESGSAGKPIITTDNVGCRDVVDDGINGYLCQPRSSEDLANKIEKFLSLSDEEKEVMGQKSREKIVKEFDEKIVIGKYLKVLKDIE